MDNILIAFLLSLFAGLATGIGSCIAFFFKRTNKKFLSFSLGFAAGVMIYVSFVELLTGAIESVLYNGVDFKVWVVVASFFIGFVIVAIIDRLVPKYENPHDIDVEKVKKDKKSIVKLHRLGILVALVIALHNFPEGFATFASALKDTGLGIAIAIAVAIHNIPEGISISVPLYYATGSKKKAFIYSFLTGLAEPLGALIAYFILFPFLNEFVFAIIFAVVAGIMVFISFDQLLPAAKEYGEHHISIYGLICGMMVMAVSLLMFY
jgi:ZIP family zinc transporter